MKKTYQNWSIKELINRSNKIEFPEFQREPSIWRLEKKQRLIDSIIRKFDISTIYFFESGNGKLDCIDGQQRINAIWSFIGINDADDDNGFHLKMTNEIYDDGDKYSDIDQTRFENEVWKKTWKAEFEKYEMNIVVISKIEDEEVLNLQFLRLQLGAPLNSGEKLHAMTGDMRDEVFNELKNLKFFQKISIRNRRYAKEEVAAQISLNAFSKREEDEFHRSRYVDLQDFFKRKDKFSAGDKKIIGVIKDHLEAIAKAFGEDLKMIDNKAISVSVFLFISELIDQGKTTDIKTFNEFLIAFLKTKKWQIPKGLDMDLEYRAILEFQTNVTQAAGEKTAIKKRHDFWRDYFYHYKKHQEIKGDAEYQKRTKKDPKKEREKIVLKNKKV